MCLNLTLLCCLLELLQQPYYSVRVIQLRDSERVALFFVRLLEEEFSVLGVVVAEKGFAHLHPVVLTCEQKTRLLLRRPRIQHLANGQRGIVLWCIDRS